MPINGEKNNRVLEIIPVNPKYQPNEVIAGVHFGRISPKGTDELPVDRIILLSFDGASKSLPFQNLVNSLSLIPYGEKEVREMSIQYPEMFTDIKNFRIYVEMNYPSYEVFLNVTPFSHHFHAMLFRDGLQSKIYHFWPYEILDPRWRTFKHVFVPNYFGLNSIDWEIIAELGKDAERMLSLHELQEVLEMPGWNKNIKTIDQKLRGRLGHLVEQGLLDFIVRANGEKFYFLRKFPISKPEENPELRS
jgi:hypothetical protein